MAITRASANIEFFRGDNPLHKYKMSDYDEETEARTPIDLTTFVITGQIRSEAGGTPKLMEIPIVVTDAANGEFQWQLTEQQAKDIDFTSGVYDMQLRFGTDPNDPATQVFTFLTGNVTVVEDITRTGLALFGGDIAPESKTHSGTSALDRAINNSRGA